MTQTFADSGSGDADESQPGWEGEEPPMDQSSCEIVSLPYIVATAQTEELGLLVDLDLLAAARRHEAHCGIYAGSVSCSCGELLNPTPELRSLEVGVDLGGGLAAVLAPLAKRISERRLTVTVGSEAPSPEDALDAWRRALGVATPHGKLPEAVHLSYAAELAVSIHEYLSELFGSRDPSEWPPIITDKGTFDPRQLSRSVAADQREIWYQQGQKGHLVELVMLLEGCRRDEAIEKLLRLCQVPFELLAQPESARHGKEMAVTEHSIEQLLAGRYGLDARKTMRTFGLAFDDEHKRMAIPLRDKDGFVLGSCLRALWETSECERCGYEASNKEMRDRVRLSLHGGCPGCGQPGLMWLAYQWPRYQLPRDFDRSHFLYNQQRALRELPNSGALYVVDSYASCWILDQAGRRAVVALNSGQISDWQTAAIAEMAVQAGKPVVIVPGFDPAGAAACLRIVEKLRAHNPQLDLRVADLCQNVWKVYAAQADYDGPLPTSLSAAAGVFGVDKAADGLSRPSHWAVWRLRELLQRLAERHEPLRSVQAPLVSELFAEIERPVSDDLRYALGLILRYHWSVEGDMSVRAVDEWLERQLEQADGQPTVADREWIAEFGSDTLKHGLRRGYEIGELYVEERAKLEIGQRVIVDAGRREKIGRRNHPSREAIALELALIDCHVVHEEQTRIVWVEGWGQEAIVVDDYLGRYRVLVPVES